MTKFLLNDPILLLRVGERGQVNKVVTVKTLVVELVM